jgi:hypothetical protein
MERFLLSLSFFLDSAYLGQTGFQDLADFGQTWLQQPIILMIEDIGLVAIAIIIVEVILLGLKAKKKASDLKDSDFSIPSSSIWKDAMKSLIRCAFFLGVGSAIVDAFMKPFGDSAYLGQTGFRDLADFGQTGFQDAVDLGQTWLQGPIILMIENLDLVIIGIILVEAILLALRKARKALALGDSDVLIPCPTTFQLGMKLLMGTSLVLHFFLFVVDNFPD